MSDYIRTLQAKDKAFEAEFVQLHADLDRISIRLRDIVSARSQIQSLLKLEGIEPSAIPKSESEGMEITVSERPLIEILTDVLADGKARTTDELAESARAKGVQFGEKSPKRIIHATLMGASRHGAVNKDAGKWQIGNSLLR